MAECWNCGDIHGECNCPSPEEFARREAIRQAHINQDRHEASIRKQKSKLKLAPWRDPEHPEFRA